MSTEAAPAIADALNSPDAEPSPAATPPGDSPPAEPKKDEHWRLGGRPRLKTIMALSIGPLMAQATTGVYGIVDTIWVSKAIGEIGMTAISTYSAFDGLARSFGFFLSAAAASQISALFGLNEGNEAAQVMADLIRVCLCFGVLIPGVFLPLTKPLARWIGAGDEVVRIGWDYMLPLLVCSVTTCMFMCAGGCLQGEGRSFLFAMMNLISTVLNGVILNPLLMLAIKLGIRGCAFATIISEIIPLTIIAV
jgi:Na+-driven multidrug efflux pump